MMCEWQREHSQRNKISILKINIPALPFFIWKEFFLYSNLTLTAGDRYSAQMFYFSAIISKQWSEDRLGN